MIFLYTILFTVAIITLIYLAVYGVDEFPTITGLLIVGLLATGVYNILYLSGVR